MINCPTCEKFNNYECELFGRQPGMSRCPYAAERKPRNHFEMVKAMSMEQMAKLLDNARVSCGCVMGGRNCMADCSECWLEWLKEEAKE